MEEILFNVTQTYEISVTVTADATAFDLQQLQHKVGQHNTLDGVKWLLDTYYGQTKKDIIVDYGEFMPLKQTLAVEMITPAQIA